MTAWRFLAFLVEHVLAWSGRLAWPTLALSTVGQRGHSAPGSSGCQDGVGATSAVAIARDLRHPRYRSASTSSPNAGVACRRCG